MKKTQLSSLDLGFLVRELAEGLKGARIDKVYQIGERDLRINLRGDEKKELVVTPSYICLTRFEHEAPEKPSNLAMILRKHLDGSVITSFEQHGFDRIVEMTVEGRGKLIIELFSRGNVIFVDENGIIETIMEGQTWKDRTLRVGEQYVYPPETPNVRDMSVNEFAVKLADNKEIVKTLASNLGLGATYANEVLARAGVDPNSRAERGVVDKVYAALKEMLESKIDAQIVFDGTEIDVVPFDMVIYKDQEKVRKASFNEAADEYFTQMRTEGEKGEATKDYSEEISRIERVIEKQKATVEEMRKGVGEFKEIGDRVYASFQEIESILSGIRAAKKEGKNWMEFLKENKIPVKNPAERSFDFSGIEIFLDKSVPDNATLYYEKSKRAKAKLRGAEEALKKSERELKLAKAGKVKVEERLPDEPVERHKAEWYEKFRWFISSDGFLVIGGRDAETNELLIKRHTDPTDLVFHAAVQGAPFMVIKNPDKKEIPESTKMQAAEAAASYSSAWNDGLGSADVYAINPEQVSKTANSGEYLARGAFVVRGEREWFKGIPIRIAVGFKVNGAAKAVGGPVEAVKSQTRHYVLVGVGNMKSADLAREIRANILRRTNKEDGQKIKKVELDEIQRCIRAGKGMILK